MHVKKKKKNCIYGKKKKKIAFRLKNVSKNNTTNNINVIMTFFYVYVCCTLAYKDCTCNTHVKKFFIQKKKADAKIMQKNLN